VTQARVCHYRCFKADARTSMEIYAESSALALRDKPIRLNVFQPKSWLEEYSSSVFVMRFLRYWQYPRSIGHLNADIHHVLDHGYAHLFPRLKQGVSCITVHDIIPMLHWKGLLGAQRKVKKPWLNLKSLGYLNRFDHIVAISNSTRDDLLEHLQIKAEKVSVIPPVISPRFQIIDRLRVDEFARKYSLDPDAKWLMISGREFYKNHRTSLQVFKTIFKNGEKNLRLIKTGLPSSDFTAMVSSLGLESKVTEIYLEDVNELPLLYSFVDCLLFPSLYEGFGMPVIESMACGTPVVISDRGSLPEVGGDIALQSDALDVEKLAQAVTQCLNDRVLIERFRTEGPKHAAQYSADRVGDQLEHFYQRVSVK